jgi:DNA transposition AAA+ family ATPase
VREKKPEITAFRRAGAALDEVAESRSDTRIVLLHGDAGTGKTTFSQLYIEKHRGSKYARIPQLRNNRLVLDSISHAILGYGIASGLRNHELYERCRDEMLRQRIFDQGSGRNVPALMVDEADRLAPPGRRPDDATLQILRDLTEDTGWMLVLISVQRLASVILNTSDAYLRTITTRIGAEVKFEPPTLADAQLLADELLEDVKFTPDLVEYCVNVSSNSIRLLLALYAQIEKLSKAASLPTVSRKDWHELRAMAGLPKEEPRRVRVLRGV